MKEKEHEEPEAVQRPFTEEEKRKLEGIATSPRHRSFKQFDFQKRKRKNKLARNSRKANRKHK